MQRIQREGSNHARLLPVYIEDIIHFAAENNLSIDAIALSEGPGSYTGLRIGTSMAKGLCYGLNVPLIPVPTLQILCAAALAVHSIDEGWLCPMIDARRMEVYTALYDMTLQSQCEVKACIVENDIWNLQSSVPVYYFGDGAAKCQNILDAERYRYIPDIVPEAQFMGELAAQKTVTGFTGADVAYYEPFYLKEFVAAQSHVKGLK